MTTSRAFIDYVEGLTGQLLKRDDGRMITNDGVLDDGMHWSAGEGRPLKCSAGPQRGGGTK